MASIRLFEKALEAGIKNWVVAGSCYEYGKSGERYDRIPVDAPLEPVGSYSTSKAAASVAIIGLANTHQANLFIGRIFQVFGEGETEGRFWPSLRKAALAGEDFPMTAGKQIRDFIPVEDVAARFLDEVLQLSFTNENPETKTQQSESVVRIANIGTGRPQTLREFSESWWNKWGAAGKLKFGAIPYRENEVMRYVPKIG
jgi:nucleoside-diphosphate-sugar epimerase